jgi:hypothetical protein
MTQAEAGEFSLIVTACEAAKIQDAAKQFARAFSLDETIAQQICKSAPIIFAQKLSKSEVKAVSPKLIHLSSMGLEFRLTARPAGKIPKVNWPVRPQFTAAGSGSSVGLAFDWSNNAFVCPGCGESFLFQRMGKFTIAEGTAGPTTSPAPSEAKAAPAPAPVSKPSPAPKPAPAPKLAPAPAPDAKEDAYDLSADLPKTDSLDDLALPDELPPPPPSPDLPADDLRLEPPPPDALPEGGDSELRITEELPPEPEAAGQELAADLEPAPEPEPAPAPEPEPEPAPVAAQPQPALEGVDLFNVFLSKITEVSKRDKAAELIAKVKRCSMNEAKELTSRLVIPLAKNVSRETADDILNQFKKLKIFGRMTKVK